MSAAPPDIFISYAREDEAWVRPLAAELERRGRSVFWDRRIPTGKDWRSHISAALERAQCVVVVWSKHSVSAKFVLEEADDGREREVLVPILRHQVRIPLGFRAIHAADLSDWSPERSSPAFERFIADLTGLLGPATSPVPPPPGRKSAVWRNVILGIGTVAGVVSAGVYTLSELRQKPEVEPRPDILILQGAPPSYAAGQTFTDPLKDGSRCPFCPEMVVIPAGHFTMGSTPEERKWAVDQGGKADDYTDERPADYPVRIPARFALGRTEVTRGQFMRFVNATERKMSGGCNSWIGSEWKRDAAKYWDDVGFEQGDDHPAVCVSWEDATDYAAWLSQQTGLNYQLPSEAEWEYAARAESPKMRFWGDDKANQDACRYANVADRSYEETLNRGPVFGCDDGFAFTSPTAKYEPNGFALHDTLGGVWEWNQDCYRDSYRKISSIDADCDHVVRGSSWEGYPRSLRSANRQSFAPDYRSSNIGLRVARMLTP